MVKFDIAQRLFQELAFLLLCVQILPQSLHVCRHLGHLYLDLGDICFDLMEYLFVDIMPL
jgi:hypothetical protein